MVSGYFSSWAESHKMPWNMCGSQVLPGMLGQLEHVDLGALIAPRPLLIESGTHDDLFPATGRRGRGRQAARRLPTPAVPATRWSTSLRGGPPVARMEAFAFLGVGPGLAESSSGADGCQVVIPSVVRRQVTRDLPVDEVGAAGDADLGVTPSLELGELVLPA